MKIFSHTVKHEDYEIGKLAMDPKGHEFIIRRQRGPYKTLETVNPPWEFDVLEGTERYEFKGCALQWSESYIIHGTDQNHVRVLLSCPRDGGPRYLFRATKTTLTLDNHDILKRETIYPTEKWGLVTMLQTITNNYTEYVFRASNTLSMSKS